MNFEKEKKYKLCFDRFGSDSFLRVCFGSGLFSDPILDYNRQEVRGRIIPTGSMPRVLTHDNNLNPEKWFKFEYVVQLIKHSNEPKFHQISLCELLIIMGQKPWYGAYMRYMILYNIVRNTLRIGLNTEH